MLLWYLHLLSPKLNQSSFEIHFWKQIRYKSYIKEIKCVMYIKDLVFFGGGNPTSIEEINLIKKITSKQDKGSFWITLQALIFFLTLN